MAHPGDCHFHVFLVKMYCACLCCASALRMASHCKGCPPSQEQNQPPNGLVWLCKRALKRLPNQPRAPLPPPHQPVQHTPCLSCKLSMCNSSKCVILVPRSSYRSFASSITLVLDETHWHRINAKVASHVFSLLASVEGTTACVEIPLQPPPPPPGDRRGLTREFARGRKGTTMAGGS